MVKQIAQLIGLGFIVAFGIAAYNLSMKMDVRNIDQMISNLSWGCVLATLGITLPIGFVAAVVFLGRVRAKNMAEYGTDGWEMMPTPRRRAQRAMPGPMPGQHQLPGRQDDPWGQQMPQQMQQPAAGGFTIVEGETNDVF
ncbi:MAG TPA: hypothetical protein P5121_05175 [Caldilineaceae bacterium]|nr:hypothetical protein [Caldilineaceae bacterium]